MVVLSLLVILISGGLLAVGVVSGDHVLVIGSIALSLIAAIVLFIGVWRQRDTDLEPSEHASAGTSPLEARPLRAEPTNLPGSGNFSALEDTVVGNNNLPPTDTAGFPSKGEPASVSKAEHAAWARSAVASIPEATANDDAGAMMQDRRKSSVDVATQIPQLTARSTKRKPSTQATAPQGSATRADAQASGRQAGTEASSTPAAGEPVAAVESPPGSTSSGRSAEAVAPSTEVGPPRSTQEAAGEDPVEEPVVSEDAGDDAAYLDPPDEPPAELLLSYEERELSDCDAEVLVVDGRPRFHLADCLHLGDKSAEPLVLSEAAELGFTSCSLCAAATTVLAGRQ